MSLIDVHAHARMVLPETTLPNASRYQGIIDRLTTIAKGLNGTADVDAGQVKITG
jgi:hypothetical protein